MNFGSNPDAAQNMKNTQQPAYHLAPNFSTRPFPDGPLELGTVVKDLQSFDPINLGASRIAIPDGQRYVYAKKDVTASTKWSSSGLPNFLTRGQRSGEAVYTVARLETTYFDPSVSYIKQCLQLAEVKNYLDRANHKAPVYLITGLKIAWGATASTASRSVVSRGVVFRDVVFRDVESRRGWSSVGKPSDFVLGVQVLKLYYKRAFFVGQPVLAMKRVVVKNAVLADDDEGFTPVAEIGESDVDGVVPMHTVAER